MTAGAVGLFAIGPALASSYTGTILNVQITASSSGGTRVSLQVSGTTSCTGFGGNWYSFEFSSDGGPGKAWLAAMLAAKAAGESVSIAGTGTCDQYGVETVGSTNSL